MAATKRLLQPSGLSALRGFLQDELPSLMQSPVLVISSGPGEEKNDIPKEVAKRVGESCKLVQFTLAQQMGLRTVPSTVSSAFPTLADLEQRRELLRRTGASSVVAVGSGAAMDLAKGLDGGVEQVILVPCTYAGIMACGTSNSLFLDTTGEETLIPQAPSADSISVCPLDADKYMAPVDPVLVRHACLSIILDACHRESKDPLLEVLLNQLDSLLDEDPSTISHESATELLYQSGRLVSFGLGREDRSSPLTLAASLIPRIFPHVPMLTFYASLLPGLSRILVSRPNSKLPPHLLDRIMQLEAMSDLTVTDKSLEGFSIPDMAISHIQTNQTVWKSLDLPNSDLTEILQHSITTAKVDREQ